jgi:hypothetical protein
MTDRVVSQERLTALVQQWRDPEFWSQRGCLMDSYDCADDLERVLLSAVPRAPEQKQEATRVDRPNYGALPVTTAGSVVPDSTADAGDPPGELLAILNAIGSFISIDEAWEAIRREWPTWVR